MRRVWAAIGSGVLLMGVAGTPRAPSVVWEQKGEPWIDQDHVVAVHRRRVAQVGPKWENIWRPVREHMLWPDEETLARLWVPPERTKAARAECVRQVRVVLKAEHVPGDLEEHLVGISPYGANGSDFLLTRYRVGHWRVQIIYSGHLMGILVAPREPGDAGPATAEYALRIAKALFVSPRPEDAARLVARVEMVEDTAHGGIRNPNAGLDGSLAGASAWYGIRVVTDGRYVFLSPAKWGLYDDTDIRGRAGMPAHLPPQDKPILLFDPAPPAK
jgi:hypothetical protein